jgi:hypothetical protein
MFFYSPQMSKPYFHERFSEVCEGDIVIESSLEFP